MGRNNDTCQVDENNNQVIPQIKQVIRDYDDGLNRMGGPRSIGGRLDQCCSDTFKQPVVELAPVQDKCDKLYCNYPTDECVSKPLITHNGLVDIRITTDKNKALYESGPGLKYKLVNTIPEIEAPWCKRNGLQDYWMEDPKYTRKSMDIYSTPYPCCKQQMTGSIGRGPVPMEDNSRGANCCEEAVNYRPREEKPRREYQQRENYNNMAPRNKRYRDIEPLRPSDGDLNFRDDCKK